MRPVHPGEILKRRNRGALAIALRTPSGRVTDILNGKRGVSPETAIRLARYFGNSARFWLNLQTAYELAIAEAELGERIASQVTPDGVNFAPRMREPRRMTSFAPSWRLAQSSFSRDATISQRIRRRLRPSVLRSDRENVAVGAARREADRSIEHALSIADEAALEPGSAFDLCERDERLRRPRRAASGWRR